MKLKGNDVSDGISDILVSKTVLPVMRHACKKSPCATFGNSLVTIQCVPLVRGGFSERKMIMGRRTLSISPMPVLHTKCWGSYLSASCMHEVLVYLLTGRCVGWNVSEQSVQQFPWGTSYSSQCMDRGYIAMKLNVVLSCSCMQSR